MTLAPITTDIWEIATEIRLPGGWRLPLRSTVWRLPGRQLVVHSPVAIDDATAAALTAEGDVAHLVAPSRLHTRWVDDAARRWPAARVWRPDDLDGEPPAAWRDHVDQVRLAGAPKVDETVFFLRASRTLVCTDLIINVPRAANWRTGAILALDGIRGRAGAGRIWRYLVRDRAAAAASLARILAWPAARLVPAHGEVVTGDVAACLAAADLERVAPLPGAAP